MRFLTEVKLSVEQSDLNHCWNFSGAGQSVGVETFFLSASVSRVRLGNLSFGKQSSGRFRWPNLCRYNTSRRLAWSCPAVMAAAAAAGRTWPRSPAVNVEATFLCAATERFSERYFSECDFGPANLEIFSFPSGHFTFSEDLESKACPSLPVFVFLFLGRARFGFYFISGISTVLTDAARTTELDPGGRKGLVSKVAAGEFWHLLAQSL